MPQRATDKWHEERMKWLDFINSRLPQTNYLPQGHITNVDEAMLECYRVFGKRVKLSYTEPEILDFYHQPEDQKGG